MQSSTPTGITQAKPPSQTARTGGGYRWVPGPAAILLVLLQLVLIVTVALTAGGTAAVVMRSRPRCGRWSRQWS